MVRTTSSRWPTRSARRRLRHPSARGRGPATLDISVIVVLLSFALSLLLLLLLLFVVLLLLLLILLLLVVVVVVCLREGASVPRCHVQQSPAGQRKRGNGF